MTPKNSQPSAHERRVAHEKMLKEALSRPGVREAMAIHKLAQPHVKMLSNYRSATQKRQLATTTSSANQN